MTFIMNLGSAFGLLTTLYILALIARQSLYGDVKELLNNLDDGTLTCVALSYCIVTIIVFVFC